MAEAGGRRGVYEMTYEDLQADSHRALFRFFTYLDVPDALEAASSVSGDGWVKRTSDDLRNHLLNYDDIHRTLVEMGSPCLVAQLEAKIPGISFPPCPLPR
uniref:Uncharacterized protein n=1 Tax=Octactis speculum TaxID=3111310 RepID=A0A7S2GBV3_9STRA|mmetsp:Transcript_43424/g.59319  ORF Transcript_43424/g.59319 Transcript_43424/m.59319 type:complete len:101 (+) Transcript_43424:201-503(+)